MKHCQTGEIFEERSDCGSEKKPFHCIELRGHTDDHGGPTADRAEQRPQAARPEIGADLQDGMRFLRQRRLEGLLLQVLQRALPPPAPVQPANHRDPLRISFFFFLKKKITIHRCFNRQSLLDKDVSNLNEISLS